MPRLSVLAAMLLTVVMSGPATSQDLANHSTSYAAWPNGIPTDPNYFPLAVWLQSPRNAERFKDAGINLYVGLHRGPTEEQLTALKRVGMRVVCAQNETALRSENADIVVAWMHGDEPDNAQPKKSGGYGPPIDPSEIEKDYRQIQMRDATRPIFLNLGQGVAYDNYVGRGVRRNHPEDYALYIRGSDIVSFDIYPAVHDKPEVAGKLEFVPRGVERLRLWSKGEKIVWNCIEASRISNTSVKPTPQQIRSEVWMSLIKGSMGIIYFVHQFEPRFIEASLLEDRELLSAVTEINRTITSLAPVLNSATVDDAVVIESAGDENPLSVMCKRHDGSLYLFVANMSANKTSAKLRFLNPLAKSAKAEAIEDNSPLGIRDGQLNVDLDSYGIGLYRVSGEQVAR